MTDLREVFDIANRQNTSIYAVDPRGLAAFEYDINEGVGSKVDRRGLESSMDSLRVLADNTDGRAIVNTAPILRRLSSHRDSALYLIGYVLQPDRRQFPRSSPRTPGRERPRAKVLGV